MFLMILLLLIEYVCFSLFVPSGMTGKFIKLNVAIAGICCGQATLMVIFRF